MIVGIAWLLLGLIHVLPALALFRPALITQLYGVAQGTDVFTLMHHRAALFVAVVVVCVWAAFRPEVRLLATVTVGISMGSFVALWWLAGMPHALRTIALVDAVGLPILAFAGWQALRPVG